MNAIRAPRVLVAGIGNVLLGDDGFGVEVVRRLSERPLPDGVRVMDLGIRSVDLMSSLRDGYEAVILVDTAQRGGPPGTLYVIEPEVAAGTPATLATHGMDPERVLAAAEAVGGGAGCMRLVACEPAFFGDEDECWMGLSEPVAAAVEPAVATVESLLRTLPPGGPRDA
jgi:hydrogenase maturation protease